MLNQSLHITAMEIALMGGIIAMIIGPARITALVIAGITISKAIGHHEVNHLVFDGSMNLIGRLLIDSYSNVLGRKQILYAAEGVEFSADDFSVLS